jgi:hypothetical protein
MSAKRSLAQLVLQSLLQGDTSAACQALRDPRCLALHENDSTGESNRYRCTVTIQQTNEKLFLFIKSEQVPLGSVSSAGSTSFLKFRLVTEHD